MLKVWGRVMSNNKIVKDFVAVSSLNSSYQDNLKVCVTEICYKLDISKPYWLPSNLEEFNQRSKVVFDQNNFIDEIDFDKFIIEEISEKKSKKI